MTHRDDRSGRDPEHNFKQYTRKANHIEARPYEPGEKLDFLSSKPKDDPKPGDMIARDPKNRDDCWLVPGEFFNTNYEMIDFDRPAQRETPF